LSHQNGLNGCNAAFKFLTGRRITLHRWYSVEGGHITISTPFFTSPLRRTSEAAHLDEYERL
jgi:hypothetical protein